VTLAPHEERYYDYPKNSNWVWVDFYEESGRTIHYRYSGGDAVAVFQNKDGKVVESREYSHTGGAPRITRRGCAEGVFMRNDSDTEHVVNVVLYSFVPNGDSM
jgi:hypothetical protein